MRIYEGHKTSVSHENCENYNKALNPGKFNGSYSVITKQFIKTNHYEANA